MSKHVAEGKYSIINAFQSIFPVLLATTSALVLWCFAPQGRDLQLGFSLLAVFIGEGVECSRITSRRILTRPYQELERSLMFS